MPISNKFNNPMKLPNNNECTIIIIGLGYVGLPLAVEFAISEKLISSQIINKRTVIGFDLDKQRIKDLGNMIDQTGEVSSLRLAKAKQLDFTTDKSFLSCGDVFIVTVPTPIDRENNPDLSYLEKACSIVGESIKKRTKKNIPVVIFESTVYPGTTDEICIPILENTSELKLNSGFYCGYSPERINPGDGKHNLTNIKKITSGSCNEASEWIDDLYASIIFAGTHKATSIKVAEAAKIIENTQRDVNIALANELAIIFHKMNIDTLDVIEAASTKWNFAGYIPGLVGGHCIGVDPYYLTFKAQQLGVNPQMVLAGRKINDGMAGWIVERLIEEIEIKRMKLKEVKVLIMGFSFKENCKDIRNTKVIDIINKLIQMNVNITIYDPIVNIKNVKQVYGFSVKNELKNSEKFNVVLVAVSHKQFVNIKPERWKEYIFDDGIIFDIKGIVPRNLNPIRL